MSAEVSGDPCQPGTGLGDVGPCPLGCRHLEGQRRKLRTEGASTSAPEGLRGVSPVGAGEGLSMPMATQSRLQFQLQAGGLSRGPPTPVPPSLLCAGGQGWGAGKGGWKDRALGRGQEWETLGVCLHWGGGWGSY